MIRWRTLYISLWSRQTAIHRHGGLGLESDTDKEKEGETAQGAEGGYQNLGRK